MKKGGIRKIMLCVYSKEHIYPLKVLQFLCLPSFLVRMSHNSWGITLRKQSSEHTGISAHLLVRSGTKV